MFAIAINDKTIDKIAERDLLTLDDLDALMSLFLYRDYVFITGYQETRGEVIDWRVMPFYIFRDYFDYDEIKIQQDWDQIVRLNPPDNKAGNLPYKE